MVVLLALAMVIRLVLAMAVHPVLTMGRPSYLCLLADCPWSARLHGP